MAGLMVRAVALGLLEQSPDEALRVPRVLPLGGVEDEGLAAKAAEALYRIWWEGEESASEAQKLEIHRLAVLGGVEEIVEVIAYKISGEWRRKGRFREVVALGSLSNEVFKNTWLLQEMAYAEHQLGNINRAEYLYREAFENCPNNPAEKGSLLYFIAIFKAQQGDITGAIRLYEESLALTEQVGNVQGKAANLHQLAGIKAQQDDIAGAIALYEESLALKEQIGDVQGKAATLHQLAGIKAQQNDVAEAITLYEESLAIAEQMRDMYGKAPTLHCLAILKAYQGDVAGAITLYEESLAIAEQSGDAQGKAANLHELAGLKAQQGDVGGAIALYEESLAIQEQIGNAQGKATTLHCLAVLKAQ